MVRDGLEQAVRPDGADRLNFNQGSQPLVDAAFLAQAFLRAPSLWQALAEGTRTRLVDAFRSARVILPGFNNWLLFAATVEAFLRKAGDPTWDRMRIDYALRQHEQWYKGDGIYGDGPQFHFDYYNAFVIQPMLVDVLDACADDRPAWRAMREQVLTRARRYAAIQERLIAPDGSYPPVGRSLAYRCGAFQGLAQAALRHDLPVDVTPGQARSALAAVIARTLDAPGTYDSAGWLTLGLCGHQPASPKRTSPPAVCTSAPRRSCPSACPRPTPSGPTPRATGRPAAPSAASPSRSTTRSDGRCQPRICASRDVAPTRPNVRRSRRTRPSRAAQTAGQVRRLRKCAYRFAPRLTRFATRR